MYCDTDRTNYADLAVAYLLGRFALALNESRFSLFQLAVSVSSECPVPVSLIDCGCRQRNTYGICGGIS